ncbi:hypothetical protein PFISCL1PPCAC_374, partial [Pristionchus fissidentatus]
LRLSLLQQNKTFIMEDHTEYSFDSEEDENQKAMNEDELKLLALSVLQLSNDKFRRIIQIVEKRETPGNFEPTELMIDFEILQPKTLHEIRVFVAACQRARNNIAPLAAMEESDGSISSMCNDLPIGNVLPQPSIAQKKRRTKKNKKR